MTDLFEYQFVTNALFVMLMLSVTAGIIGTYIVARRMVFVAGGITHASFGGIGIAYYLGLSPIGGALTFAILTALGIEALGTRGKVREDSAIAILWSLGMAVGVIFMFLTPGYSQNLMGFMFGDVLSVSQADIVAVGIMALLTTISAIVFYRPIMYTAFSPSYASVTGWNTRLISMLIAVFVAVALVLAIKAVGIILVLSLFTIPQAIANVFVKKMGLMMLMSVGVSILGSIAGLAIAFSLDLPVGATITSALAIALLIIKVFDKK